MEELYMNIRKLVYERLDTGRDIDDAELYQVIDACIYEESRNVVIPIRQKEELKKRLYNSIKKLDILQELLEDDSVTEIMVNGSDSIFIERNGHMEKWDKKFESVERLSDVAQRIAAMSNRMVNEASPVADTRLSDGSRVSIVLPPVAINGPVITIRKFYDTPLTIERLIELESITAEAAEFLSRLVKSRYNIFISGGTGSGKTTVVNLLMRFYDVDSGEILIDDVNIKDIDCDSLRRNTAIVLQDTVLFADSIENNLRYSNSSATDEQMYMAARMSNCDSMIRKMPQGYDTQLMSEGENISQGQRQLLSIARAFLAQPKILILDEATSSVDTRTEKHIQDAMVKLMKDRTSLIIAHRLSTIQDADLIVVMDEGRIAETGSHANLLAKKGKYYQLYMTQFAGCAT